MAEIKVINREGQEIDKIKVRDEIFKGEISDTLMQLAVRAYMNARRAGTAVTKSRAMVKGSNRKIFRQKGTGNARMGRKRTNIRTGGGVAFGKKQRDFSIKLNKKIRRKALISALTSRFEDFIILDKLVLDRPKTKEMAGLKKSLNLPAKSLFVVGLPDTNLDLSIRNLENTKWVSQNYLNVFDLLYFDKIVFTKDAITDLDKRMEL